MVEAAVLLVDMAGFSTLTSRLALRGNVGSEETTDHLNAWFAQVLEPVIARGGDVTTFAGDCFGAVFTAGSSQERLGLAAAAGLQILEAGKGTARLGVASGRVWEFAVGGERGSQAVTLGPAFRAAAAALLQARADELWASLPAEGLVLCEERGGMARVTGPLRPLPRASFARSYTAPASTAFAPRALAALRPFLPETVWRSLLLPIERGEHRPVTTLFLRVGDAGGAGTDDPAAVAGDLSAISEAVARSGGYVQKIESGDKGLVVLSLFGAPVALEDGPARALAAAAAACAGGRVAAAVTTGRVFAGDLGGTSRREFTVIGEAVNRAARMLQAAPLGQVYCDPESAWAAPGFYFQAGLALAAKGFDRPLEIRIVATGEAAGAARAGDAELSPLVGRGPILEELSRRLSTERPEPLVLVGDGGLGKSRLLREAATLCRAASLVVCTGHFGGMRPFAAFAEIATALGEPGGSDPAALVLSIRSGLRRRGAPVVLFFEDLHLAEPDDAKVWREVLAAAEHAGAKVLATSRPGGLLELPPDRLQLFPLDQQESVRLLELQAPGLDLEKRLALAERAGGNPLFLEALALQGSGGETEALPRSVEEAIRVRIDHLDPLARRVLQLASVCGERFDDAALSGLSATLGEGALEQALRQLRSSRFLVATSEGHHHFAHGLDRTVAYESLRFTERRELHQLALAALQAAGGTDPAELFLHLDAIGDRPGAARAASLAAVQALELLAGHRAARFARLALERLEEPRERCGAEALLARALGLAMDRPGSAALALEVEGRAAALGLPAVELEMIGCAAQALSFLADYDAADRTVDRGLAAAERHGLPSFRPGLLKVRAWNEWGRGNYPEARAIFEEALPLCGDDPLIRVPVASGLASILIQLGLYPEAEAVLPPAPQISTAREAASLLDLSLIAWRRVARVAARRFLERFAELIDVREGSRITFEYHARVGAVLELEGDPDPGAASRERGRAGHHAMGAPYDALGLTLEQISMALLLGRLPEAERTLPGVRELAISVEARDEEARAEVLGAIVALLRGGPQAQAVAVVARAAPVAQRTQRFLLLLELGALQALLAAPADQPVLLARFVALAERRGDRLGALLLRSVLVQEQARRGAPGAGAAREELLSLCASWDCPGLLPARG